MKIKWITCNHQSQIPTCNRKLLSNSIYLFTGIRAHIQFALFNSLVCSFSSEVFQLSINCCLFRFSMPHHMFLCEQCQIITWTQGVNVLEDGDSSSFSHVKNRGGIEQNNIEYPIYNRLHFRHLNLIHSLCNVTYQIIIPTSLETGIELREIN